MQLTEKGADYNLHVNNNYYGDTCVLVHGGSQPEHNHLIMLIDNLDVSTLGPFECYVTQWGGGGVRGSQIFRKTAWCTVQR